MYIHTLDLYIHNVKERSKIDVFLYKFTKIDDILNTFRMDNVLLQLEGMLNFTYLTPIIT